MRAELTLRFAFRQSKATFVHCENRCFQWKVEEFEGLNCCCCGGVLRGMLRRYDVLITAITHNDVIILT